MSAGWKERRDYKLSRHRCGRCGEMDAYTMAGRKLCAECCEKARAYAAAHREQIKEARDRHAEKCRREGLCQGCGETLESPQHIYCQKCRTKILIRHRRKREAHRGEGPENYPRGENGICWTCNKAPAREGGKLCDSCYENSLAALKKANDVQNRRNHPWARMRI